MRIATAAGLMASAIVLATTAPAQTSSRPAPPPFKPSPPAPGPTLARARAGAEAALAACRGVKAAVAVSVVDSAGKAKVTFSDDGFGGNPATSVKKGAAAAFYKQTGTQMEARETLDPAFAAEVAGKADQVNVHAGSAPVLIGGVVLGGVGVTGAPTHEGDQRCAEAGAAAAAR